MKASQWVRPDIASMTPYTPVVPFGVLVERLGRPVEEIIKLNANENPYGPSPRVRAALAELPFPHIYPDPESGALRRALSGYTGVPADLLLAGAGADELIDLTMRLFLLPGDCNQNCPPTFGMYPFDAAICGATVISVPRREDLGLELDRIEDAARKERPKLLFVTSPNNPDGGLVSDQELLRLLELPLVVVLDEAYIEFAAPERSRIGWVERHENLIVLRTFSKWAGLAGLRLGYGAFPASIISDLWKIKQPYGVSQVASAAGIAALQDLAWAEDKVARIVEERERLLPLLSEVPYLSPYPSRSNFVLCRVLGRDAVALKETLEMKGILIRYYRSARLQDHIRISVGTPKQMETLIEALRRT